MHSFTGSVEEMQRVVDMGFDIGVNGCSMKSKLPLPPSLPHNQIQQNLAHTPTSGRKH